MKLRWRVPLLAVVAALGGLVSCANPRALKDRQDKLRLEIAEASQLGAKDCAPEVFARAESQLVFSDLELAQGDYLRADEHITEGFRMARAAIRGAKNCDKKIVVMTTSTPTPTPVVVVTTPTPTPEPVDTDGDGITDDKDRCPKDPGPRATKGCPDRDADFVADLDDKCPDEPGAPSRDGCPEKVVVVQTVTPTPTPATPTPTPTPTPATPTPTPDVTKIDTDGDGVPDIKDKCPATVGPAANDGCPYVDSDEDGVTDDRDKCPATKGLPKYDGCPPPDRDKDGIADADDKCPNQAAPGTPDGCPQFEYIVINQEKKQIELKQQVHFASGKSVILPDSFKILNEVAEVLIANRQMEVRIEGHTDSVGKATYNLALSKRRADAVMTYLASKGVPAGQLRAVGLGETTPIASNTTPDGRALNRRVEFHIVKQ